MTDTTPACPVCAGPQMAGHPGGPLVFQHVATCALLAVLDSRVEADARALLADPFHVEFDRAATPEEIALAAVAGLIPGGTLDATVTVSPVAGVAVVNREIRPTPYRPTGA